MKNPPRYLTLLGAKQVAREHGVETAAQYRKLANEFVRAGWRLPPDPVSYYAQEFPGWHEFLREPLPRRTRERSFLPYERAQEIVRAAGITSRLQYEQARRAGKLPRGLPALPPAHYVEEWEGWPEFVGKEARRSVKPGAAMPFEQARELARAQGFRSQVDFQRWVFSDDFPPGMPRSPYVVYRDRGWKGWPDFLGIDSVQGRRRLIEEGRGSDGATHLPETATFSAARRYVRELHLNSIFDYRRWANSGLRPEHIPESPEVVYQNTGWKGWPNFLGVKDLKDATSPRTGRKRDRPFLSPYLPFHLALDSVHAMKLKSADEYIERLVQGELGTRLPPRPDLTYAGYGWEGWAHYLGARRAVAPKLKLVDDEYLPYKLAKRYVRPLGLDSIIRWVTWANSTERPPYIPPEPWKTYLNRGFESLPRFLGVPEQQAALM